MSTPALGPDPRPQLSPDSQSPQIKGWICENCRHPLALPAPWCPLCRGALHDAQWGPSGRVWSSTVLRVPLPGRTPPLILAYVDLDDGPRVLGHVSSEVVERLHVGERVTLVGPSPDGDLLFATV
ncbi:MAG: OB-fold domain-containing protein [Rhodococcus sp. (in: high G+C Gram-positive bacteria)]|uniref:Zn-ribbon domain-containing OB-fold protein n=1 Tax=Rhodococcus sp. TaxID=1831 RepID=UPI003BB0B462